MEPETSVEVAIRVKPPASSHLVLIPPYDIRCDSKFFAFDYVFPSTTTHDDIYLKLGTKLVANVQKGYNSCIFAYGQTGSGKTHTMTGPQHGQGLIQACMNSIWAILQSYENFEIKLSYYEIYNEQINDLLVERKKDKVPIKLKESLALGFYLDNITETKIQLKQEMINELMKGLKQRTIAETKMNQVSSRSHSILTLKIVGRQIESKTVKSSKIHFVDLAGSEKQKATEVVGERLKEASKINTSLTQLSRVIEKLANKATHIPYRNSILTKILKDSLGGNSKTILLATVSSDPKYFSETLSTLNFAAKAKNIELKAKVNEYIDERNIANLQKIIAKLQDEIKELRSRESLCRNCESLQRQYEKLELKNEEIQKSYHDLEQKHEEYSDELVKLQTYLKLKENQVFSLQLKIERSSESYSGLLQQFKTNLKKCRFDEFSKQLLFLQKKKISELTQELEREKKQSRQKEQILKSAINKVVHWDNRKPTESQQSQEILNLKKLEEDLESLKIIRLKESQEMESLRLENSRFKQSLDVERQAHDFTKKSYLKQIKSIEDDFQDEIKRIKEKSFQQYSKKKQRIISDYYCHVNRLIEENKEKDRNLHCIQGMAKIIHHQCQERIEKTNSDRAKLVQEKKEFQKEKRQIRKKEEHIQCVFNKLGAWMGFDVSFYNFDSLYTAIRAKIKECNKLKSMKNQEY